jgi:DNA-binding winged helix-turn-helix (wHTH) protein
MPFNGRGLTTVWYVCGPASSGFAVGYSRMWRALLLRNGARLATVFDSLGVVVSPQSASVCRFGVFELDSRAAELRKNGVKLRLQEQPYQVLLKLIEHHGEIVGREELRSTLWHEGTFVDFETGLNTAIKRLRETLGDSADSPTFIETLPRRGYRFIATVERPVGEDSRISGLSCPPESSAGKNLLNTF